MRHALPRAAVLCLVTVLGLNVTAAGAADASPSGPSGLAATGAAAGGEPSGARLAQDEARPHCGGQRPVKRVKKRRAKAVRYRCTFADEFDGTQLDPSVWVAQQTWFSAMSSGNFDCLVDDPDNISVSGGVLRLTAREEGEEFLCRSPAGDFMTDTTGANVSTYQTFSQAYGRFSFRARFPDTRAPGVHSALWLYPAEHTYGRWPDSGEIDVAEWFSSGVTTVLPSLHYRGEKWPHTTGWSCSMDEPWRWHTYTVDWTRTEMRFVYDGRTCWRTGWTPDAPLTGGQPFDQPFFLTMSQVFGFNRNAVTEETPSSATLEVNWVRVWK